MMSTGYPVLVLLLPFQAKPNLRFERLAETPRRRKSTKLCRVNLWRQFHCHESVGSVQPDLLPAVIADESEFVDHHGGCFRAEIMKKHLWNNHLFSESIWWAPDDVQQMCCWWRAHQKLFNHVSDEKRQQLQLEVQGMLDVHPPAS